MTALVLHFCVRVSMHVCLFVCLPLHIYIYRELLGHFNLYSPFSRLVSYIFLLSFPACNYIHNYCWQDNTYSCSVKEPSQGWQYSYAALIAKSPIYTCLSFFWLLTPTFLICWHIVADNNIENFSSAVWSSLCSLCNW